MNPSESCIATNLARALAKLATIAFLGGITAAIASEPIGTVGQVSGGLIVKSASGPLKVIGPGASIAAGDTLISQRESHARIRFVDGGEVTLQPATLLKIEAYAFHPKRAAGDGVVLRLAHGGVRVATGSLGTKGYGPFRLTITSSAEDASAIAVDQSDGATFIAQYVPAATKGASPDVAGIAQQGRLAAIDVAAPRIVRPIIIASIDAPTLIDLPMERAQDDAGRNGENLQLAQTTPSSKNVVEPGLYVHVIDGLVNLSNKSGTQNFSAGQFGFSGSVVKAPVVVPSNPGIRFNPPPSFSSTSNTNSTNGSKPNTVDCEVR